MKHGSYLYVDGWTTIVGPKGKTQRLLHALDNGTVFTRYATRLLGAGAGIVRVAACK